MSRNLSALSGRQGLSNNLFDRLGQLSEPTGSPDAEALRLLAEEFLMGPANLYGTATFYDFTRPENQGKQVYLCNGSACQVAGTQAVLKAQLLEHFAAEEIGEMCCLGRCHENSSFHYKGNNYSGQSREQIQAILAGRANAAPDQYQVASLGDALLTSPFPDLPDCREVIRTMLAHPSEQLLESVKTSGLRGRGGAGFPFGIKMNACRQAPGDMRFVVCNADEGDPGSYSDRYLLENRPFAVLLGMLIAGYGVGAHHGVVYLRAEYPEARTVLETAMAALYEQGLAGKNLFGSGFDFDFKLIRAQGAYVCGEETALLASIEGQRPEVRVRPPFPAEEGLFGKPTLVSNVETMANLYFILTHGGEAFSKIGTARSSGTKLLSLNGLFNRPGVYEVPMGTALETVVNDLAGGFRAPVKALHIGGPLGGIVPLQKIPALTVDFESFSQEGFLLGHASVIAIPADFPMIKYLEHLFEFAAHESCGKCFPCRLGSVRGQELLHKARHEAYRIDTGLFNDLLETLEKGSLCALGGGIPLPVRNAMQYFPEELKPFFTE